MTLTCDSYPYISNEYICPKVGGGKKKSKSKKRSVSQLGGNCLYAGKPLSVNVACAPNDCPSPSQMAWSQRYNQPSPAPMKGGQLCNFGDKYLNSEVIGTEGFDYGDCAPSQSGGDGYSLMPGDPVGGQPGFMRYTDNCRPVFPGEILPQKVGGGMISSLVSGRKRFKNRNIKDVYGECNGSCDIKIQKGGVLLGEAVQSLAKIIFPMGKNSLIALIVLLFTNHLVSSRKTTKKQMGGNLTDYYKMFVLMGKNSLLALASILLIHYFVKNKKKRIQKGGALLSEVSKILAPLGVDQFGTPIVLLILNEAVRRSRVGKKGKKSTRGGGSGIVHPLIELIAPLGVTTFVSTGVLVILDKMFKMKRERLHGKTRKGGSMTSLVSQLKEKLNKL